MTSWQVTDWPQIRGRAFFDARQDTARILTAEMPSTKPKSSKRLPVVIADVWDNPGGGVPGDSTILLREMLRRKIKNAALATIWDPIAVRTMLFGRRRCGVPLRFGAKMSEFAGEPLDADVIVKTHRARRGLKALGKASSLG